MPESSINLQALLETNFPPLVDKTEAPLAAADGNKLEAKGVIIPSSAKVTVLVTRKDLSKLTANFTMN